MLLGPLDPLLQLGGGVGCTGGVVGAAQIDDVGIHRILRHGQEVIFGGGRHILDGASGHDIVIHIDRVNRVGHQNGIVHGKQVQQVAQVALGAVGDEDFLQLEVDAPAGIVFLDGLTQEIIALLGAVAAEGGLVTHLVHRLVQRGDDRLGQRQRHVADTQTDDVRLRVSCLIGRHLVGDVTEQVAFGHLGKMLVQIHGLIPSGSGIRRQSTVLHANYSTVCGFGKYLMPES